MLKEAYLVYPGLHNLDDIHIHKVGVGEISYSSFQDALGNMRPFLNLNYPSFLVTRRLSNCPIFCFYTDTIRSFMCRTSIVSQDAEGRALQASEIIIGDNNIQYTDYDQFDFPYPNNFIKAQWPEFQPNLIPNPIKLREYKAIDKIVNWSEESRKAFLKSVALLMSREAYSGISMVFPPETKKQYDSFTLYCVQSDYHLKKNNWFLIIGIIIFFFILIYILMFRGM